MCNQKYFYYTYKIVLLMSIFRLYAYMNAELSVYVGPITGHHCLLNHIYLCNYLYFACGEKYIFKYNYFA